MDPMEILKQEQENKKQFNPQTIREHLTDLQEWDELQPGETIEMRRSQYSKQVSTTQQKRDAQLMAGVQQLPQIQANDAAPGQPMQETAPAQKTFKEKQREKREAKAAKKETPVGTYQTYRCKEGTDTLLRGQFNAINPVVAEAKREQVDVRVLRNYTTGFQLDKKGRPATLQDAANQRADQEFLADYISKDLQRRKPHLDRMLSELLDAPLEQAMLSDAYIDAHAREIKLLTDRAVYLENIMKDPVNKPYFDALDPLKLSKVLAKQDGLISYSNLFINRLGAIGVSANHGTYYGEDSMEAVTVSQVNLEIVRQEAADVMAQTNQQCKQLSEQQLDAAIAEYRQEYQEGAEEMREMAQRTQGMENLGFTSAAAGYSFTELSKYRTMIEENPDAYSKHHKTVDQLYQQLHHSIDAMGDQLMELVACQSYIDTHVNSQEKDVQELVSAASARMDKIAQERTLMEHMVSSVSDTLETLLKGTELSAPAAVLVEEFGLTPIDIMVQRIKTPAPTPGANETNPETVETCHETIRKAVEFSNKTYEDTIAENKTLTADSLEKPGSPITKALVNLDLRTTSTDAAIANKRLRATTYNNVANDILQYMKDLESGGIPVQYIEKNAVLKQIDYTKAYHSNGQDSINAAVLDLYFDYMETDASITYLQDMYALLKDAKAFEGQPEEVMNYLLQTVFTTLGGSCGNVGLLPEGTFQNKGAIGRIWINACTSMIAVTSIHRYTEEQRKELPPAILELAASYETLLTRLTKRITGDKAK